MTATRFAPFGTTIFAEMTRLATLHQAVNLSQGFPDFDGPTFIIDAAEKAMREGHNQYARMSGEPVLCEAIAHRWARDTGMAVDPDTTVTVTSGCTEALAATFLGLLNPGDEVILFEPWYDSYQACAAMAGAVPRLVPLRPDADGVFRFDEAEFRAAWTPRTRAVLVNTPHNPTGKVFTREELDLVASCCRAHDAIAITDEVYEHIVFEGEHVRLATLPGMEDRTITLSSLGKTFSLTGWKIGWAIAPPHLTRGIRSAHQFLTFAIATPFQHGAVVALRDGDEAIAEMRTRYRAARDHLASALDEVGFRACRPQGTYFIMADHSALGFEDDVACCRALCEEAGIAAIPPTAFYTDK
ncbi:MAG: aminotransferase class I/II-fold pyridoxal phosphate-dependent enzyme, partial [Phycisphaerales bacterium]|nr:aminotransferase class I/II-fold pyridoxal phosphate-dependent enzyme [Phycisphaerales bacterium]